MSFSKDATKGCIELCWRTLLVRCESEGGVGNMPATLHIKLKSVWRKCLSRWRTTQAGPRIPVTTIMSIDGLLHQTRITLTRYNSGTDPTTHPRPVWFWNQDESKEKQKNAPRWVCVVQQGWRQDGDVLKTSICLWPDAYLSYNSESTNSWYQTILRRIEFELKQYRSKNNAELQRAAPDTKDLGVFSPYSSGTDRHESENRGHPFKVWGTNFPSIYHQGAVQIFQFGANCPDRPG